ncbi:MAG TPA: efflux RND transporter periplasmic adaptor subunit [Thermoanaerobaculia bacterium]|nr:efflux RND transporter periplasmic adaptor subunit [Thermoanaerobaculia bacterium]
MKRGHSSRLALAAVLLLAAASVLSGCRGASAAGGPPPTPGTTDADVRRILLTGELAAVRSADLFVPETPLWELQLRFLQEDGAAVKAGERVAEFDGTGLTSDLEQKRIAAIEAETELVRFDADREGTILGREQVVRARTTDLEKARIDAGLPAELTSRRDHEEKLLARKRAETELEKALEDLGSYRTAAEAERATKLIALERARSERDKLETAVSLLTLRAPKDGVFVVAENPRERKKLMTGDTLWPGMTLARIPDLEALRVDALLFDVDDGRIRAGDAAMVIPDSFPDRRLSASVESIAPVAQPVGRGSPRMAFRVSVGVTGGDLAGLRPGMSVRVEAPPAADTAPPESRPDRVPDPDLASARSARAERRDLVLSVELKGELAALDAEAIGPVKLPEVWDYRISFLAPEGSEVKKGQPVLGFDTTNLRQQLEEKRAEAESAGKEIDRRRRSLAIARGDLELQKAQVDARRAKAAMKVDVPPEVSGAIELRKARLDLDLAQAEAGSVTRRLEAAERAARAELSVLEGRRRRAALRTSQLVTTIERMTIPSPRSGTVLHVPNWNGEKRKVGDNCWFGEKILQVPDLARLGVQGEVDEADAGLVREGAAVSFRLDAHPDTEVRGKVRTMQRTVQRASPQVPLKVARLSVALEEIDPVKMKPGMRVRGRVETGRVAGALTVPSDSVVPTEEGPFVWVPRGRGARQVRVTVGRRNEEWVEIRSGLAEGDSVLRLARPSPKGTSS